MKLNEITQDRDEIRAWLDKYNIRNYTIHENGVVDVAGHVSVGNQKLITHFPFQFGRVEKNFYCLNTNNGILICGHFFFSV